MKRFSLWLIRRSGYANNYKLSRRRREVVPSIENKNKRIKKVPHNNKICSVGGSAKVV
jgi:hypothetical protein